MPAFNRKFMQPATEKGSTFVPNRRGDPNDSLCEQFERAVGNDNCMSFEGMKQQIPADRVRHRYVKVKVRVLRYRGGGCRCFMDHGGLPVTDPAAPSAWTASKLPRDSLPQWLRGGQFICYNTGQFHLWLTLLVTTFQNRQRSPQIIHHGPERQYGGYQEKQLTGVLQKAEPDIHAEQERDDGDHLRGRFTFA